MELVPQLDHSVPGQRPGKPPFYLTASSWVVFAIYAGFCLVWPLARGLPVMSMVWGVYFIAAFVAAIVGLGAAWVVYWLGRGSLGAANFLFSLLMAVAFSVTACAMVRQDHAFRQCALRFSGQEAAAAVRLGMSGTQAGEAAA